MYELEAVTELEGEYENELEGEGELEGELEGEYEGELEGEFEAETEAETEAFFGSLARLAGRALRSPTLRRMAQTAVRAVLNGTQAEFELENETEFESEFETESTSEAILSPIRRVYPDALMEHFGHAAAEAESETEAEAFAAALVPLARRVATRALPRIARAAVRTAVPRSGHAAVRHVPVQMVRHTIPPRGRILPRAVGPRAHVALRRVTPHLVRGVTRMARTLRRIPRMRPLVRVLPTVVQRTVNTLGQRAALGGTVTPGQAIRTLARQSANVIGSPQQAVQAYRHSVALDRGYHTGGGQSLNLCPSCRQRVCSLCKRSY
jgi:hypothetical protein